MENPMRDVLDAMWKGVEIGNVLQSRRRQTRLDQLAETDALMRLSMASRPAPGGIVTTDIPSVPLSIGTTPGASVTLPAMKVPRKAEPGRYVRYKTMGGESIERELLSREELAAQDVRERLAAEKALDDLRREASMGTEAERRRRFGLTLAPEMAARAGLPADYRYLPAELGSLDQWLRVNTPTTPRTATPVVRSITNAETGDVTPAVIGMDEQGNPVIKTGAPLRGAARPRSRAGREHVITDEQGNVTLVTTRGGRVTGKTPLGKIGTGRSTGQGENAAKLRDELAKLEDEEARLNEQRMVFNEILNKEDEEEFLHPTATRQGEPVLYKMNALWRSQYRQKEEGIRNRLKRIIERKNKLIRQAGGTPEVSEEQAFKALDEGVPKRGAKQASKTATATQISAYAKQKGITEAQARKEFTDAGYQVTGSTAGPKKGDKRTYMGATYTFDGHQWVRQEAGGEFDPSDPLGILGKNK